MRVAITHPARSAVATPVVRVVMVGFAAVRYEEEVSVLSVALFGAPRHGAPRRGLRKESKGRPPGGRLAEYAGKQETESGETAHSAVPRSTYSLVK